MWRFPKIVRRFGVYFPTSTEYGWAGCQSTQNLEAINKHFMTMNFHSKSIVQSSTLLTNGRLIVGKRHRLNIQSPTAPRQIRHKKYINNKCIYACNNIVMTQHSDLLNLLAWWLPMSIWQQTNNKLLVTQQRWWRS